jgi:hypothetical protein
MKGLLGIVVGLFVLRHDEEEAEPPAWLDAFERAQGTPLAELLPERSEAQALELRLEAAVRRLTEADRLLAQPEFSEEAILERSRELARQGDHLAAGLARLRLDHIARVRGLRDQLGNDLEEIRELLVELRLQADAVRRSGVCKAGARALVAELLGRVEALKQTRE